MKHELQMEMGEAKLASIDDCVARITCIGRSLADEKARFGLELIRPSRLVRDTFIPAGEIKIGGLKNIRALRDLLNTVLEEQPDYEAMQKRNRDLDQIHKVESRNIEIKDAQLKNIAEILQRSVDLNLVIETGTFKRLIGSINDTLGLEWQYPEGSEEMQEELERLKRFKTWQHRNLRES